MGAEKQKQQKQMGRRYGKGHHGQRKIDGKPGGANTNIQIYRAGSPATTSVPKKWTVRNWKVQKNRKGVRSIPIEFHCVKSSFLMCSSLRLRTQCWGVFLLNISLAPLVREPRSELNVSILSIDHMHSPRFSSGLMPPNA